MDNPEKLATLGAQDTGWRQTKQKLQHRKLKRWAPKTGREPRCSQRVNSSWLLQDTRHVLLLLFNLFLSYLFMLLKKRVTQKISKP